MEFPINPLLHSWSIFFLLVTWPLLILSANWTVEKHICLRNHGNKVSISRARETRWPSSCRAPDRALNTNLGTEGLWLGRGLGQKRFSVRCDVCVGRALRAEGGNILIIASPFSFYPTHKSHAHGAGAAPLRDHRFFTAIWEPVNIWLKPPTLLNIFWRVCFALILQAIRGYGGRPTTWPRWGKPQTLSTFPHMVIVSKPRICLLCSHRHDGRLCYWENPHTPCVNRPKPGFVRLGSWGRCNMHCTHTW